MTTPLDESRRRLRSYLLPGSATDEAGMQFDDSHFPRSKVMRFAFNPRGGHAGGLGARSRRNPRSRRGPPGHGR